MHGKILVPSDQSQESETVPPLAKQIKGILPRRCRARQPPGNWSPNEVLLGPF